MKKLLILLAFAHLALESMENDSLFETLKTEVSYEIEKCSKELDFSLWKKTYQKLYTKLPRTPEALESLMTAVNHQNYDDPILLFLLHKKRNDVIKQTSKQSAFSRWLSSPPECFPVNTQMLATTDEQFEKWVKKAAEKYKLILPFTDFAKYLWKDEVYAECSLNNLGNFGYELSKKVNATDLHYLSTLNEKSPFDHRPSLKDISIGKFNTLKLTTVPEDVCRLRNLNELKLYENNLDDLPESLAQLKQLKILYLGTNQFKELPAVIAQLKLLQILWANNNQLQEDPHKLISELPNISNLNLSNNKLTSFEPNQFPPSLKELNLGNNQIKKLPSIPKLSLLQYLNVKNNPLEESPYTLIKSNYHLKKLIDEDGNTIEIKRP